MEDRSSPKEQQTQTDWFREPGRTYGTLSQRDKGQRPADKRTTKTTRRGTFVVTQGEVRVASDRRIQREIEAVSAHRVVFVHAADGLDDLRTFGTETFI